MKKFCSEINTILQQKYFFEAGNTILCPVSGGQDSITTLFALFHTQPIWNFKIQLIYCQHFWQKNNFLTFWYIWKIAYIFQTPITIILAEFGIESEESAHYWRQSSFHRMSSFYEAVYLFLGHTASDRIETALLNLMRGTSPRGFVSLRNPRKVKNKTEALFPSFRQTIKKSIKKPLPLLPLKNNVWNLSNKTLLASLSHKKKPRKHLFKVFSTTCLVQKNYLFQNYLYFLTANNTIHIIIARPLLSFHRNDITKLVTDYNLPVFIDFTNKNLVYTRNRIRYELIPTLQKVFPFNFDVNFHHFLDILVDEQIYFEKNIAEIAQESCITKIQKLENYPIAVQRQLIYQLCTKYSGRQQILTKTVENIRLMTCKKNYKKSGLPGTRTRN